MIDHLTNDMHIYDQVCLNVRDIHELKLVRLPITFHESSAKLRAIDPCLVDIRLSPSDEHEHHQQAPISRRLRDESIGSNGGAFISSSSNGSSSSFDKTHDDSSIAEQTEKFRRLTTNLTTKPVTLLAKKVLPKKIERRTDMNSNNNPRPLDDYLRKASPIRVTITSKLNPNAAPFYVQQRQHHTIPAAQNSSLTFYEQNRFRPRVQPAVSSHNSQTVTRETGHQKQNHHHQRFIPPRQMAIKKNFNTQLRPTGPPDNYRNYSSSFSDTKSYPQHQPKRETSSHEQLPGKLVSISYFNLYPFFKGLIRQTSSTAMDQILSTPPMRERLSVPNYNRLRRSPASLHSTGSLPYQQGHSGDRNQFQPIGSHRGQRTISGTSSGSSLSVDIGPHSITQRDSTSNLLISAYGQYDFEKANEEFRRYLELEELVTRRAPSACSTGSHLDDNSSQGHSYKKEISFFDRISCTATTGTAVAYAEMDEAEKNLETFGDDALFANSNSNDNEWQI
jgi:hypothetical protein